ncbi:MAG: pyridoxal-phosphate dependent enzyme [Myxococcota bacterium]
MRNHPLHDRLRDAPRSLDLATLPTPVQRAAWWDHDGREVWIKRDDLSSPLYGGGKVRKLELLLANPPFDGREPVTSSGGLGSNHLVALALYLRTLGRRLHAIVFDQPMTPHVRTNLAVMASLDATFWYTAQRWQLPLAWGGYYALRRREHGQYMTPGASTPLAALGFVNAGLELAAQIRAGECPHPKTIFITGGTGGASSGLAVGLALAGVSTHVRIVSAVEPALFNRAWLTMRFWETHRELARRGLKTAGPLALMRQAGVRWSTDHDEVGEQYGAPTATGRRMQARAAEHGLHLDPTYTAKCAAALDRSREDGPVLFWTTHASNDLSHHIVPNWEARLPARLRQHVRQTPVLATPA